MSTTDELLANAESYAASFTKGDLPLPPDARSRSSRAWTPASTRMACSAYKRATHT
jgi:hypothetical protein